MQTLGRLLAMSLLAALIAVVAVVSIQNIDPVSIRFLVWQSFEIPFGVLLAFGIGLGLVCGSLIPLGSRR